jgi:hypothetical protein
VVGLLSLVWSGVVPVYGTIAAFKLAAVNNAATAVIAALLSLRILILQSYDFRSSRFNF